MQNDPTNAIRVPNRLQNPHPLIRKAQADFREIREDAFGRLHTPRIWKGIGIRVSRKTLSRALIIMNTLFKKFKSRGWQIEETTGGSRAIIKCHDETISIHLIEMIRRKLIKEKEETYSWRTYSYEQMGKLKLRIDEYDKQSTQTIWKDQKNIILENQLDMLLPSMVSLFELKTLRSIERKKEWLREEEEQKKREELIRLKQQEETRLKKLIEQAEQWKKTETLNAFLNECERHFKSKTDELKADSPELRWLKWGRSYANQLNPINIDLAMSLDCIGKRTADYF